MGCCESNEVEHPQAKAKSYNYVGNYYSSNYKIGNNNKVYVKANYYNDYFDDDKSSRKSAEMKDRNNQKIGRVGRYGEFYDSNNQRQGRFDDNGDIYNEDRINPVGRIDDQGNIYGSGSINPIGRIDDNGNVYNTNSVNPIGRIDDNGNVYNTSSINPIGNASGMDKKEAAYLYFFK